MTRRTGITIITIVLLAALAAAVVQARRPHGDGNVSQALERAGRLYEQGELDRALRAAERAVSIIANELGGACELAPYRSNAAELLSHLDLYRAYALGSDPENDQTWARMTEMLADLAEIEARPEVPRTWRGLSVSTWSDGRVLRVGDVSVSHWSDGRILRVGDDSVSYWGDGRPLRIGGIDFRYGGGSRRPTAVGGVYTD